MQKQHPSLTPGPRRSPADGDSARSVASACLPTASCVSLLEAAGDAAADADAAGAGAAPASSAVARAERGAWGFPLAGLGAAAGTNAMSLAGHCAPVGTAAKSLANGGAVASSRGRCCVEAWRCAGGAVPEGPGWCSPASTRCVSKSMTSVRVCVYANA